MYQLSIRPYYESLYKCYKNILVVDRKPTGALARHVRLINNNDLSAFQIAWPNSSSCGACGEPGCVYAVQCFGQPQQLMTPNEITQLTSFLLANGYTINYELTKVLRKSEGFDAQNLLYIFQ